MEENKFAFLNKDKLIPIMYKIGPILIGILSILISLWVLSLDLVVDGISYVSLWEMVISSMYYTNVVIAGIIFIVLFIANIVFYIGGTILVLTKNKKGYYCLSLSNLLIQIAMLILQIMYSYTTGGGAFLIVLNLLLACGSIYCSFIYLKKYRNEIEEPETTEDLKSAKKNILIMDIVSIIVLLSLFIVPLFSYTENNITTTFWMLQALSGGQDIGVQLGFLIVLLTFIAISLYFIHNIAFYISYEKTFVKKSHNVVYGAFAISLVYFLIGYFVAFYYNVMEKEAKTISFIPLILMTIVLILYSLVKGKYHFIDENQIDNKKNVKFEPLLYLLILTIVSFGLLFINVIEIKYEYGGITNSEAFTGLSLLQNHSSIGGGHQVLAFAIFAVMVTSFVLLVICSCAFFAKNKDYNKITKISVYINVIFMFILGMSGFYFKIAQKINEESLIELLNAYGISFNIEYVNEITSKAIYLFVISLVVLMVAMFRGALNVTPEFEVSQLSNSNDNKLNEDKHESNIKKEERIEQTKETNLEDFDACPTFTELDRKKSAFDKILEKKKEYLFNEPTLPELVKFIVEYARESRLHLSYTHEDIATFVAGLGASRLTILQGMSGTGKTSLPKIFSEAILGNCEIIEVESSWRDKNELLGYYNEFSKTYSPKKFTERLYKAKLNPDVVTFIVLDEMNLSRIEYYFSDFLSLMEHEEHKRKIKLLNVKLQRTENNQKYSYLALEEGHTLKIPTNVWFIGTANRDESTFEISDKVYDRAQTMNFNKRAPKVRSYTKPIAQKFIPYQTLSTLLHNAIEQGTFEAEDNEIIKEVEKILQPFNISFGNRVLKQIEEFVKIYCACFTNGEDVVNEAVEKIILSKVVAKLEFKNVDNKDKLVKQFNKLNLFACSEFVSKLNED